VSKARERGLPKMSVARAATRDFSKLSWPEHEDHKDMKRWCGGHFDPEWFDLALVNKDLAQAFKPNVKRRPHQPRPARRSKTGTVH
jgi:hypothetical protein